MSNEKEHRPSELRMIPLDRIEVLNPRERNSVSVPARHLEWLLIG